MGIISDFEQVLDSELFFLQVIDREKLKSSLFCFENIVLGAHDSLYRTYTIITDRIHLFPFLLIPNYHITKLEPYQIE